MNEAIELCKEAGLYETCVEIYNIMLPIYRHQRDYKKQAELYGYLKVRLRLLILVALLPPLPVPKRIHSISINHLPLLLSQYPGNGFLTNTPPMELP